MTSLGFQECHMLEGASNFVLWKCRLHNLLEEFDLWGFVEGKVLPLPISHSWPSITRGRPL
jgi:hypothetical protein